MVSFDIFVATDGGPFVPWLLGTTLLADVFPGERGHQYGFFSVVTDDFGARQPTPTGAQASTEVRGLTVAVTPVSPDPRDTAVALTRKLGKTPVVVKNAPGFLVNRILMPYLNEGLHLFREGVHIESLDAAMTDFGMPMGPLRLLDEIGLDVADKVSHILGAAFGDRVDPAGVLGPMVEGGRTGRKGGLGFYRGSWDAYRPRGFPREAYLATREEQIAVGKRIRADVGWGAWPACSIRLGLR